jgi:hypothetical protein
MLRKEFRLKGAIKQARAYVTSRGLYQMELNGRVVGDELFTPGWTAYLKRLQYQTYDVTDLLKSGVNCVGAVLGDCSGTDGIAGASSGRTGAISTARMWLYWRRSKWNIRTVGARSSPPIRPGRHRPVRSSSRTFMTASFMTPVWR